MFVVYETFPHHPPVADGKAVFMTFDPGHVGYRASDCLWLVPGTYEE